MFQFWEQNWYLVYNRSMRLSTANHISFLLARYQFNTDSGKFRLFYRKRTVSVENAFKEESKKQKENKQKQIIK